MRIVTWNVNSLTARMPRVLPWLEENTPDVVCMQETKQKPEAFPTAEFAQLGYSSVHNGDGRWNGVAILSRVGLESPRMGFGNPLDEQGCRLVTATCGGIRVSSVYVPNGRSLDSEHYQAKLVWLDGLRQVVATDLESGLPIAVCGDFNVAPNDDDVWDIAKFIDVTHTSAPERAALSDVMNLGLSDAFRRHNPDGGVFSWWDYRAGDFHEGRGMRIDLILLSEELAQHTVAARVDRNARKGQKPSDHAPVIVDIDETP